MVSRKWVNIGTRRKKRRKKKEEKKKTCVICSLILREPATVLIYLRIYINIYIFGGCFNNNALAFDDAVNEKDLQEELDTVHNCHMTIKNKQTNKKFRIISITMFPTFGEGIVFRVQLSFTTSRGLSDYCLDKDVKQSLIKNWSLLTGCMKSHALKTRKELMT